MSKDTCPYSNREVILPTKLTREHPVKCPDCGAIRTLNATGKSSNTYEFPEHNRLTGYARSRKHWELYEDLWILTNH